MMQTTCPPPKKRSTSSRRGFSFPEAMITVFIFSLVVTCMAAGLRAMSIGASQQVTDTALGLDARKGVDEMLSQMRYARDVTGSHAFGGKTYTTNGSTIVMTSYGYDPLTPGVVLPTVTDYMIFEYDAASKQIRETLIPGAGSTRIARTNYVIAKNVESVTFTYRARDQEVQRSAITAHTLSANAISKPLVSVNGEPHTGGWLPGLPNRVGVTAKSGADVQFFYPVSPADTDALDNIQQVDVEVNLSSTDSRNIVRKLTMSGSACLRNRREEE